MAGERLLVLVARSETLRQTVEYAVQAALEGSEERPTVRFAYLHPAEQSSDEPGDSAYAEAEELLDRVTVWAGEDAGDDDLTVETVHLGTDRYVFSPSDVAQTLVTEARSRGLSRIVIDPEYDPGIGAPLLQPLEFELSDFEGVTAETAPVARQTRRAPLLERTSAGQVVALFVLSFGFYQVLAGNFTWVTASPSTWGDRIYWLDIVTGAVSASVVSVSLSRVVLSQAPARDTFARILRGLVYVPYLLFAIIKANVLVATVILDPRLPIEPRLTRVRPAIWGGFPVTMLANSITLTPGTLTVRVSGRDLLVHTLVPAAREDLFDGGLERAVRFVFYGRAAMRVPSLRERGEAEMVSSARVRPGTAASDTVDGAGERGAVGDETGESGTRSGDDGGRDGDETGESGTHGGDDSDDIERRATDGDTGGEGGDGA